MAGISFGQSMIAPLAALASLLGIVASVTAEDGPSTAPVVQVEFGGQRLSRSAENLINKKHAEGRIAVTLSDFSVGTQPTNLTLQIGGQRLAKPMPAGVEQITWTREELAAFEFASGDRLLTISANYEAQDAGKDDDKNRSEQINNLFPIRYRLRIDREGPRLVSADVAGTPHIGLRLILRFDTDDLHPRTVIKNNFVFRDLQDSDDPDPFPGAEPVLDGNRVTFHLGRPSVGRYLVRVLGKPREKIDQQEPEGVDSDDDPMETPSSQRDSESLTPLRDLAGNPAGDGEDQQLEFTALPAPERGEHVEFPRFTRSTPIDEDFNPGDHVETRVARLYYFRDAHRVAQIINRTARPHRAAEVDQAQRRAADQRERADGLTRDRQQAERRAEEVARQLRQTEARLSELQSMEQQRRRLQRIIDSAEDDENGAQGAGEGNNGNGDARTSGMQRDQDRLDRLPEQDELESAIATQRSVLRGLQDEAVTTRERREQLQFDEDRAREEQFRLEVASAKEDPDTYAPAKVDSIDPVAQVSVSVIGEGVLQLRGPIAGINKIRTMIDQIDTPLGQVRVDLITVQLNGERGDRLEEPVSRANAYVDLSRFLTSQSLALLRRAIQSQAAMVAEQAGHQGHYQVDRDRKYLYRFFGRDFIDELYEMDSEFLHSENKLLSLHSMDTVSLNQALFILSLARRDVRQQILEEFRRAVLEDLPQAEWDYRRSAGLVDETHHPLMLKFKQKHCDPEPRCIEQVFANAAEKYHFRNFEAMFDQGDRFGGDPDTMTPLQREFIRLAQIFKARMIAEVELKQRIVERGLIQSNRRESFQEEDKLREKLRKDVLRQAETVQSVALEATRELSTAQTEFRSTASQFLEELNRVKSAAKKAESLMADARVLFNELPDPNPAAEELIKDQNGKATIDVTTRQELFRGLSNVETFIDAVRDAIEKTKMLPYRSQSPGLTDDIQGRLKELQADIDGIKSSVQNAEDLVQEDPGVGVEQLWNQLRVNYYPRARRVINIIGAIESMIAEVVRLQTIQQEKQTQLETSLRQFLDAVSYLLDGDGAGHGHVRDVDLSYKKARDIVSHIAGTRERVVLTQSLDQTWRAAMNYGDAVMQRSVIERFLRHTRKDVDHIKLLDFLIDERQEKFIELQEGTRAHLSWMDNYLKRLAVALEDDFKVQFQEPAFAKIRQHARSRFVTLSQIERTSILTNNRALGKVTPQATMEFDLPKRKVALVEAFEAAKAVAQDAGALLNDPTFLATFQMMGGGPSGNSVQGVIPTLPSSTDQAIMGINAENPPEIGAALQALVPPPAIYKFETGTGYEVRPVIQPDGHSCVFDLLYMYTTNIREPVAGDEKHLGRVRRHFIDTQVQLASFEMREVSRYQVALKAARTAQGVPLLQDIPLIGVAFRPLPSAESSIQQNIILGHSIVYPTLFDMMGLRWAPAVIDLDHTELRNLQHVVRGRNRSIEDAVFGIAARNVDEMLDLKNHSQRHIRPDLYHPQRDVSPYHPNGFTYQIENQPLVDPRGSGFEVPDRRPPEMRDPPYDQRRRSPMRYDQVPPTIPGTDRNPGGEGHQTREHQQREQPGRRERRETPEQVPPGRQYGDSGAPDDALLLNPPDNQSATPGLQRIPESSYQQVPQQQFQEIPDQQYQSVPQQHLRYVPEPEFRVPSGEPGSELSQPDEATQGRHMGRPVERELSNARLSARRGGSSEQGMRYVADGIASQQMRQRSRLLRATFVDEQLDGNQEGRDSRWQGNVAERPLAAEPRKRRQTQRLPPVVPKAR